MTTSREVLALFSVVFLTCAVLVVWLMWLRVGVYEPDALPIFLSLFVFGDYWPAVLSLFLLPLCLLEPVQTMGVRMAGAIGRRPWTCAFMVFVALAVGARFVYAAHPLSMDEYAPSFQSKVFAAGHLSGQFPVALLDWLVPPGFQNVFLVVSHETGQVLSAYWPGFALLLTPFEFFGVPWLCNPLVGALSIVVLHRLAVEIFGDHESAGLAMLFAIASTAFSINSISFYSMSAHALANATFALLLLRPSARRCFAAGLVGSLALALHNPFPHALFAIPWLVWLAIREDRRTVVPAILAGYLPMALLLGIGWHLYASGVKGDVATTTIEPGVIDFVRAAVGSSFQWPSESLLWMRLIGLAKLWIWAVPGLIPLAVTGWWLRRSDSRIKLLAWSCATTWVGYLFVAFDQGHGWGFRYFHSAWLCLPLLAVAAVVSNASDRGVSLAPIHRFAAGVCALVILPTTALQAWQVHDFVDRHLAQVPVSNNGVPKVLILSTEVGYYAADLVQNDPFLRDGPLRLISHGRKANEALMRRSFGGMNLLSRSYRGEVWGVPAGTEGSDPSRVHFHDPQFNKP